MDKMQELHGVYAQTEKQSQPEAHLPDSRDPSNLQWVSNLDGF
jgi:hypothetical protein